MITANLSSNIESAVHAFSHLQTLVISQPTSIEQFPHLTSIPCLNLLDIPFDCGDWKWLSNIKDLSDFRVSFRGIKAQLGSIHVLNNKAVLNSDDDTNTVSTLMKVMHHIPMKLATFDASITGSQEKPASLKVADSKKIELTHVNEEESFLAIEYILGNLLQDMYNMVGNK